MSSPVASNCVLHHEDEYDVLRATIAKHFAALRAVDLYTTDADLLFDIFLAALPEEDRQYYNCHACKDFINHYGGLVTIDENGLTESALWDIPIVPNAFYQSLFAMITRVINARVIGVFVAKEAVLGKPVTGEWTHFYVDNQHPYRNALKTPHQYMAEKQEDYNILIKSLYTYPVEAVEQAVKLLSTDVLYRAERVLEMAEWFLDLHRQIKQHKTRKDNLIWRAVATAPAGWCHIGTSMIGTLLDDIVSGMEYNEIARRFAAKMHPLQYQRPQVAPTAGNIARAEEIVAKLGLAPSLARRFARLDEVQLVWQPRYKLYITPQPTGVFADIQPKQRKALTNVLDLATPPVAITWAKFARTVLPNAQRISYKTGGHANFTATVTAVHADAPPILQWDLTEARNPCSQYVYHGDSDPTRWNLAYGWHDVTGVMLHPSLWHADYKGHKLQVVTFLLDGCVDTQNSASSIFPENLKADLHEVRAMIEAYSKQHALTGAEEASACGIRFENNSVDLRVETQLGASMYRIDRWE